MADWLIDFEFTVNDVLTNATQVLLEDELASFGVKRLDDDVVIVAAGVLLDRPSTGHYQKLISNLTEGSYQAWVRVDYGGVTRRFERQTTVLASDLLAPVGTYATHQDVVDEAGEKNLTKLSDLDGTRNSVKMAAVEQKAISLADELINSMFQLAGYQLPLAALPGFTIPLTLLKICAAKIAHWQLYNLKGKRDNDQEGDHLTEKMQWAIDQVQRLIDGGMPAVLIPGDPTGGNEAQRGVIRTIKINQARYNQVPTDEFSYP